MAEPVGRERRALRRVIDVQGFDARTVDSRPVHRFLSWVPHGDARTYTESLVFDGAGVGADYFVRQFAVRTVHLGTSEVMVGIDTAVARLAHRAIRLTDEGAEAFLHRTRSRSLWQPSSPAGGEGASALDRPGIFSLRQQIVAASETGGAPWSCHSARVRRVSGEHEVEEAWFALLAAGPEDARCAIIDEIEMRGGHDRTWEIEVDNTGATTVFAGMTLFRLNRRSSLSAEQFVESFRLRDGTPAVE